jgi:hypothetical protein
MFQEERVSKKYLKKLVDIKFKKAIQSKKFFPNPSKNISVGEGRFAQKFSKKSNFGQSNQENRLNRSKTYPKNEAYTKNRFIGTSEISSAL